MRTPARLSALLLASAFAARAESSDGGAVATPQQPTSGDDALKKELEKALQQDASGKSGAATPSGPGTGAAAPQNDAPAAATAQATPPPVNARGSQSLNPDLSAIVDADFGYERRAVAFRNGDDPDLGSTALKPGAGPAVQEVELALSAVVDPYLKGEVYLTIPNLSGLEVEEAFATTTSLPGNLQVKAGSFRSAFGRQNGQHLHVQDFTRRPLLNAAFLGVDGLRGAGTQVSWLTPLPIYLTLYAEVYKLGAPDPAGPVASFGGGTGSDLTYTGVAKFFVPIGDDLSVYAGFNAATGLSPNPGGLGTASAGGTDPAPLTGYRRRSVLVGGDLYVKWKPANVAGGYQSLSWQTEAVFRNLGSATDCTSALGGTPDCSGIVAEWDGGLYSQVVFQLARRWFLGVRGDLLGLPSSSAIPSAQRGSVSLTFQASEFARLRAYAEVEHLGSAATLSNVSYPVTPEFITTPSLRTAGAAYLQLEISIGAHGAHPF